MKYPRQCDVTQEGMTEGWVWYGGTFYTKYLKDTIDQLRKNDRDDVLVMANQATIETLEYPSESEDFFSALKKANNNQESDQELLMIACQIDYLYYTEWDESDIEDLQYDDGK